MPDLELPSGFPRIVLRHSDAGRREPGYIVVSLENPFEPSLVLLIFSLDRIRSKRRCCLVLAKRSFANGRQVDI